MSTVKLRLGAVSALLFCSGACALVYQVAWFRELRLVFGASTAASAAVLAIFMGGLGLGGAWLGRRADRVARPLALYAQLELAVAVSAALTPGLVWIARLIYLAVGGHIHGGLSTALRMLLAVLVLGPSTVAMGGTMPAAARAVERSSLGRQRVAVLYAVNTAGAVVGTVVANFVALEVFGTRLTLWLACLANVLVGVAARMLARGAPETVVDAPAEAEVRLAQAPRGWFPPFAAAIAGFAFMVMELVWYRMLAPLLGGSSYTFGLILAVALVGIGLGGWLYSRTTRAATPALFALTCGLEALAIAIPFAVGDRVALGALLLRPFARATFGGSVLAWTVVTVPVVLPAAIVSGFQFPTIIGLHGQGSKDVGRDVGRAYLANTIGSIVGSLGGGFGLLPLLSAPHLWQMIVLLLVGTALLAAATGIMDRQVSARVMALSAPVVGILALVLVLVPSGPTAAWRHSGIGAGRSDEWLASLGRKQIAQFVAKSRSVMVWEEDGVESTVGLSQEGGFAFVVNGKIDGHGQMDAGTQIMSGLLPALLHPGATSAFIVGLGTGGTAGYLGKVPTMTRVDVAELEPAVLRVAQDCAPVNRNVLDNPKVHPHIGDAREVLATTSLRYDIVFSEPSNPYRAGVSSLYTTEFYGAVDARLNPGGIFAQWMQAYEVDSFTVATVATTLRSVFPKVSLWQTMHGDLLFLATHDELVIDAARVRERLELEPWRDATRTTWRTSSLEGVLSHFVASPALIDALVAHRIGTRNHDDQNFLEYAFAREVGHDAHAFADIHSLAQRLDVATPAVRGEYDPELVLEERLVDAQAQHVALESWAARPSPALRGFQGFLAESAVGNATTALERWKMLSRKPRSDGERSILAEMSAAAGADAFPSFVDGVSSATERDLLRAIWLSSTHDEAGALDALERGFIALRSDPWPKRSTVLLALSTASRIGARPDYASRLARVLLDPFSVEGARDERLKTLVELATTARDPGLCVNAFDRAGPLRMDVLLYTARVSCYRLAGDHRLRAAEADLEDLLAYDTKLGAEIPTPPRASPPQR